MSSRSCSSGVFDVVQLTGEPPADDRRDEPRLAANVPARISIGQREWPVRLVDISPAGALLDGAARPPPGVHTLLLGPDGAALRLLVKTVWRGGRRHAVRLLAIDEPMRLELAELLDRLGVGRMACRAAH